MKVNSSFLTLTFKCLVCVIFLWYHDEFWGSYLPGALFHSVADHDNDNIIWLVEFNYTIFPYYFDGSKCYKFFRMLFFLCYMLNLLCIPFFMLDCRMLISCEFYLFGLYFRILITTLFYLLKNRFFSWRYSIK